MKIFKAKLLFIIIFSFFISIGCTMNKVCASFPYASNTPRIVNEPIYKSIVPTNMDIDKYIIINRDSILNRIKKNNCKNLLKSFLVTPDATESSIVDIVKDNFEYYYKDLSAWKFINITKEDYLKLPDDIQELVSINNVVFHSINADNDFYNFIDKFEAKVDNLNSANIDDIQSIMCSRNNGYYEVVHDYRAKKIALSSYTTDGLKLICREGTTYFAPDYDYLVNTYGKYISSPYKDWLNHFNKFTIDDASIDASAEELRAEITYLEKFLKDNPRFVANAKVNSYIATLYSYYTGQPDNSSAKTYLNGKRVLTDEFKESYLKFLEENKDSRYYSEFTEFYNNLKNNNYTFEY